MQDLDFTTMQDYDKTPNLLICMCGSLASCGKNALGRLRQFVSSMAVEPS